MYENILMCCFDDALGTICICKCAMQYACMYVCLIPWMPRQIQYCCQRQLTDHPAAMNGAIPARAGQYYFWNKYTSCSGATGGEKQTGLIWTGDS